MDRLCNTLFGFCLLIPALLVPCLTQAENLNAINARQLMEDVYSRHKQYPFVYEEQSMILSDNHKFRTTRRARLYTRLDEDNTLHFLLVFVAPEEIRGISVLAHRYENGESDQAVYIPALGQRLIKSSPDKSSGNFLGTDFSVESVIGEDLDSYRYEHHADIFADGYEYHLVNAYKGASETVHHRHHIRTDNYFICKTEFFDSQQNVSKLQTYHDIHRLHESMWRSNMMLMQDLKQRHESLIKIDQRVFSEDYVPMEVFSPEWLFANYQYTPDMKEQLEAIPVEDRLEFIFDRDTTTQTP